MKTESFRIGDWVCQPRLHRLCLGDREIQVEPKVMQVLICLASRPGELLSRQELLDSVWADTAVSEQVLSRAISELRKVFGDDSRTPTVIETIAKSGYRLLVPVEPFDAVPRAPTPPPSESAPQRRPIAGVRWLVVGVILGAFAVLLLTRLWSVDGRPIPADARMELSVVLPAETTPQLDFHRAFDLSPDGRILAYTGQVDGQPRLYLRRLDREGVEIAPGGEGAYGPFFSPDGRELGFYSEGRLRRVTIKGGEPVNLFDDASDAHGASWGSNGSVVFTRRILDGLWIKPAAESARPLTTLRVEDGERSHFWPYFLPDGRHLLFTVWDGGSINDCRIDLLDLETDQRRTLIESGSDARYVAGRLLYARGTTLMQAPFDVETLRVTGPSVPVRDGLWAHPISGVAHFAVAEDGTLLYAPVDLIHENRALVWTTPGESKTELTQRSGPWAMPRLSPDNRTLAATRFDDGLQIWLRDLERGTEERLTNDGQNIWPLWSPDGKRIVFSSERAGAFNLYSSEPRVDAPADRLTDSPNMQFPGSFHPDGNLLAYSDFHPDDRWDIWVLSLDEDAEPQEFLRTPFDEFRPTFSPDGDLIAYVSNESGRWDERGRWEVYLRRFDDPTTRVQVSTDGGVDPVWSDNGNRLYFRNDNRLLAVDVQRRPNLAAGRPTTAVEDLQLAQVGVGVPGYDVAADGRVLAVRLGRPNQPVALRLVLGEFPTNP